MRAPGHEDPRERECGCHDGTRQDEQCCHEGSRTNNVNSGEPMDPRGYQEVGEQRIRSPVRHSVSLPVITPGFVASMR